MPPPGARSEHSRVKVPNVAVSSRVQLLAPTSFRKLAGVQWPQQIKPNYRPKDELPKLDCSTHNSEITSALGCINVAPFARCFFQLPLP